MPASFVFDLLAAAPGLRLPLARGRLIVPPAGAAREDPQRGRAAIARLAAATHVHVPERGVCSRKSCARSQSACSGSPSINMPRYLTQALFQQV